MNTLQNFDAALIHALRKVSVPLARLAMFVIFFWFGFLKIIGTSPANPLVQNLLESTLPFMTFETFIVGFAVYEMIIGIAFLIPRCERLALALLIPHMIMTTGPLVLLPEIAWQGFMTPTLEGQYIIKNFALVALAIAVISHITPFGKSDDVLTDPIKPQKRA